MLLFCIFGWRLLFGFGRRWRNWGAQRKGQKTTHNIRVAICIWTSTLIIERQNIDLYLTYYLHLFLFVWISSSLLASLLLFLFLLLCMFLFVFICLIFFSCLYFDAHDDKPNRKITFRISFMNIKLIWRNDQWIALIK